MHPCISSNSEATRSPLITFIYVYFLESISINDFCSGVHTVGHGVTPLAEGLHPGKGGDTLLNAAGVDTEVSVYTPLTE